MDWPAYRRPSRPQGPIPVRRSPTSLRWHEHRYARPMITGFLHPGAMGSAVAAQCRGSRLWASQGRSSQTATRAAESGLTDCGSLAEMVSQADMIVSVCPPDQALALAHQVSAEGFEGVYVDANAISPATAHRISEMFDRFVDGGIIGPPPKKAGSTRMYLSSLHAGLADHVAERWDGSNLGVRVMAGGTGAASAIKMCFAAWTKQNSALLLAINALAAAHGISAELNSEWATSMPDLAARSQTAARTSGPKAWRFEGEMHEIAATFADSGLPAEFHLGAAEIYKRMKGFKGHEGPSLGEVLESLAGPSHR